MRSVYIFNRDGNNWNQHYVIQDVGSDSYFGSSVAIQGDYVIIGSTHNNVIIGPGGLAYVYRRYDSYWAYQIEVSPASSNTGDNFGSSIAIDSTNVIIGAYLDDNFAFNAGSASIYDMSAIIELTDTDYCTVNSNPIFIIAFPNPFNPSTTISFDLTAEITKDTELVIYNLKGQKVKTFNVSPSKSQTFSITWNGKDSNNKPVSSGVYFAKLKAGNQTATRKMLLMK